jgi:membrane protein implicated in regulation of membrane protease activity
MFEITPSAIWLIVGLICLAIEFTKLPGIGFLFLGLGSLINSVLVYNYPFFEEHQYTSFGLVSFLSFILLWWPLKKYMYKKSPGSHFSLVGSEVEVYANPIMQGHTGQVKWSGTIMNAKLVSNSLPAEVGEILVVTEVQGNVLICRKSAKDPAV